MPGIPGAALPPGIGAPGMAAVGPIAGPPGDIACGPPVAAAAAAAAASLAFISSEIVGGATGFSSSSSCMTPLASLHTHRPRASSNTKEFSSFKLAVGTFFLPLPPPHMLPSTRPNNPLGFEALSSPSGVAGVGDAAAASFFALTPAWGSVLLRVCLGGARELGVGCAAGVEDAVVSR